MSNYENAIRELEARVKNQKYFDSPFRMQLFMLLNAYGELSLPELAEKTGKSKPTITKHLKYLDELDWVSVKREKVRGNKEKIIYRMNVDHQTPSYFWKLVENINEFPDNSVNQFLITEIESEILLSQSTRLLLEESEQHLQKMSTDLKFMDPKYAKKYFVDNRVISYGTNLTKEEFIEYQQEMHDFHEKFLNKIEKRRVKEKVKKPVREYFASQFIWPIKKMVDT